MIGVYLYMQNTTYVQKQWKTIYMYFGATTIYNYIQTIYKFGAKPRW